MRFIIIDDHPLFREALIGALKDSQLRPSVREASNLEKADAIIKAEGPFDLALLDLSMPGITGFQGLLALRANHPNLPVMVVSGIDDPRIIHEALSHNAAGYVVKSAGRAELAKAVETVLAGKRYTPPGYDADAMAQYSSEANDIAKRLRSLTPQQMRVLGMLRQGLLNKQIAHELGVGETTVKAHVSEILRKLQVFSRTQAVIEAQKIDFDAITETATPQTSTGA